MGRFRQLPSDDGGDFGIDISPLIDMVFILLIFFIVTTTFVEETGVEVDKPQAASSIRLEKTRGRWYMADARSESAVSSPWSSACSKRRMCP
jgi:biopolymer transport protein ExbD